MPPIPTAAARVVLVCLVGPAATPAWPSSVGSVTPWGEHGHRIAARAAATGLPRDLPAFFRGAAAQLEYLGPEPDRWRSRWYRAMDEAFAYDHYIDLENVPEGALDAPDRWTYLAALRVAGLAKPERDAGFLPYRIVELQQRLTEGFHRWRNARDRREREWIEARIVNDAGILGHYVTDGSQPHHTTIHYDGWDPEAPNPRGFSTERGFHGLFESDYVRSRVDFEDVLPRVDRTSRRLRDVKAAVMGHLLESHGRLDDLYRLHRDVGFTPDSEDPRLLDFTAERLAAGAEMLRDLWWTAWVESGEDVQPPPS